MGDRYCDTCVKWHPPGALRPGCQLGLPYRGAPPESATGFGLDRTCWAWRKRTRPYVAKSNFGHDDLIRAAVRWLRNTHPGCDVGEYMPSHAVVATELFTTLGCGETGDAVGFGSHGVTLIECKQSRADFAADLRKPTRQQGSACIGSRRFYLTPPGLLSPSEIPEGWGLLEAHPSSTRVVSRSRVFDGDERARDDEMHLLVSIICRLPTPPNELRLTVRWIGERVGRFAEREPRATVTAEACGGK